MTLVYLLLWGIIAFWELGDLYRAENRTGMAIWLAAALWGPVLWLVYNRSAWRLAEWLLELR